MASEEGLREGLKEDSKEFLKEQFGFHPPRILFAKLRRLTTAHPRFRDITNPAFERLVNRGLMSLSAPGNYSLDARISPGYSLNPRIIGDQGSKILYFVSRTHAKQFLDSKLEGVSRIICCEGDYVFPEDPAGRDWQELYIKLNASFPEPKEMQQEDLARRKVILSNLVARKILQPEKGFRVYYKPGDYKNKHWVDIVPSGWLSENHGKYYFVERSWQAVSFMLSFPEDVRRDMDIVEE